MYKGFIVLPNSFHFEWIIFSIQMSLTLNIGKPKLEKMYQINQGVFVNKISLFKFFRLCSKPKGAYFMQIIIKQNEKIKAKYVKHI